MLDINPGEWPSCLLGAGGRLTQVEDAALSDSPEPELLVLLSAYDDSGSVFTVNPVEFPRILRNSLEVLFLNDNQLDCVPPSLCGLHSLTELYLSR